MDHAVNNCAYIYCRSQGTKTIFDVIERHESTMIEESDTQIPNLENAKTCTMTKPTKQLFRYIVCEQGVT